MSNYRRLISYIYAYEGGVKGKNIGFAKIETRGVQCKITVSVKKIYVGGNDIGVYLLAGEEEIFLGNIFIRGGSGEFRTVVAVGDVEHSGVSIEECCGLTVHDVDSTWRCYTTIWEDAVAHAAEVELGESLVNKEEAEEAMREARIKKAVREIAEEFPLEPPAGPIHSYIGNRVPAVEFSQELAPEIEPAAILSESAEIESEPPEVSAAPVCEKVEKPEEIREPEKTEGSKKIEEPERADNQKEIREPDPVVQQNTAWDESSREQNMPDFQSSGWETGTDVSIPENSQDNIVYYRADNGWNQETPCRSCYEENQNDAVNQAENGTNRDMESFYNRYSDNYNEFQKSVAYRIDAVPKQAEQDDQTPYINSALSGEAVEPAYHMEQSVEADYAQPMAYSDGGQPVQPSPQSVQSRPDSYDPFIQQENLRETSPVIEEAKTEEKQPAPGDPDELERLRRLEEEEENNQNQIWEKLRRERAKIFAFDYEKGCEILTIKPQDIGLLPRETWVYGNNSFLLHGYYNYRYLILAKLNNPQGTPRYLLGVPGHYYSNERYMASMFGFPEFVLSKDQPAGDGRFGYWYTDIRLDQ